MTHNYILEINELIQTVVKKNIFFFEVNLSFLQCLFNVNVCISHVRAI